MGNGQILRVQPGKLLCNGIGPNKLVHLRATVPLNGQNFVKGPLLRLIAQKQIPAFMELNIRGVTVNPQMIANLGQKIIAIAGDGDILRRRKLLSDRRNRPGRSGKFIARIPLEHRHSALAIRIQRKEIGNCAANDTPTDDDDVRHHAPPRNFEIVVPKEIASDDVINSISAGPLCARAAAKAAGKSDVRSTRTPQAP